MVLCVWSTVAGRGLPSAWATGTTPGARLQMGAAESNYLLRLSVPTSARPPAAQLGTTPGAGA